MHIDASNPTQSFLVQAPAGSGKTSLLVKRYLKLLAKVERVPEEIIALTFTKKAALEMRTRVLSYLIRSKENATPKNEYDGELLSLGQTALTHLEKLDVDVVNFPHRLQMMTLDKLNQNIVKRIPQYQSNVYHPNHLPGVAPQTVENPQPLYQRAIQRWIEDALTNDALKTDFASLMCYLGGDYQRLMNMAERLLETREQWAFHLIPISIQLQHNQSYPHAHVLQETIAMVETQLQYELQQVFTEGMWKQITVLAQFAMQFIEDLEQNREIAVLCETSFENTQLSHFSNLAKWILKKSDKEYLRRLTIKQGFPDQKTSAQSAEMKKQMTQLIESFESNRSILDLLQLAKRFPAQENIEHTELQALLRLLPHLLATLNLIFEETNQADFIGVALSALDALGTPEHPTDLMLYFDYRYRHILVDEFQDTSDLQFRLLQALVQGWSPHDGRTLFVVGDPMQSIYRFRKAEVGLFLQAKLNGIGPIPLQFVALEKNYRSHPQLVEWNNAQFQRIFHQSDKPLIGAIQFFPSIPALTSTMEDPIQSIIVDGDAKLQAQHIQSWISHYLKRYPEHDIAVLTENRRTAYPLIRALGEANIPFECHEFVNLKDSILIQDLLTLLQILREPQNEIAWHALLRAPFVGLTLSDQYAISQYALQAQKNIWDILCEIDTVVGCSEDGKHRVSKCVSVLQEAYANRPFVPFALWYEGIWWRLGGFILFKTEEDEDIFQLFMSHLLDVPEVQLDDLEHFKTTLYKKHVSLRGQEARVHFLTCYAAKGLEFDAVVLPFLEGGKNAQDLKPLIRVQEFPHQIQGTFATFALKPQAEENSFYEWMHHYSKLLDEYERARLFYVATTRAKSHLALFASLEKKSEQFHVSTNSFLKLLNIDTPNVFLENDVLAEKPHSQPTLLRVKSDFAFPIPLQKKENRFSEKDGHEGFVTGWNVEDDVIGTFLHEWMAHIIWASYETYFAKPFSEREMDFKQQLQARGISEIEALLQKLKIMYQHLSQDETARWILKSRGYTELELKHQGQLLRLDRVIDEKNFIGRMGRASATSETHQSSETHRSNPHQTQTSNQPLKDEEYIWVIDYKFLLHEDKMDREHVEEHFPQYLKQIQVYEKALRALFPKQTIKSALYFPWNSFFYVREQS